MVWLQSLSLTLLLLMPLTATLQTASAQEPLPESGSARAAAISGDYETAVRLYRRLLAAEPENADYLLGISQTLLWQGKPELALPYLQQGIQLAPEYLDLYHTLFQALVVSGRADEAESIRATAAEKFNNPPWTQIKTELTKTEPQLNLQLSNQLEFPAPDQPEWRYTTIELGLLTPKKHRMTILLQNSERFGQPDTTVGLNGYYRFNDKTGLFISTMFSPTHEVMPEQNIHLQLSYTVGAGWGGIGGLKLTEYTESDVVTADLTIERYFGNYRSAYTLILADSSLTGKTTAHRLQWGRYFESGSQIQLAWTTGEEIEKPTNASTLLSSRIDTMAIWGEIRLTKATGLLYGLGKAWIKFVDRAGTNREYINLGINHYF